MEDTTSPDKLAYTVEEAAEVLSISRSMVYKLLKENPLFPRIRIGKRVVIPIELLKEWVRLGGMTISKPE